MDKYGVITKTFKKFFEQDVPKMSVHIDVSNTFYTKGKNILKLIPSKAVTNDFIASFLLIKSRPRVRCAG